MFDITVVSQNEYVDGHDDTYANPNAQFEDRLVVDALKQLGLSVTHRDWADPEFDWGQTRFVLIRSIWDYFARYDEFVEWLVKVEQTTTLINSSGIIHWNKHKQYLKYLMDAGVNIAPSRFLRKGDTLSMKQILSDCRWNKAVIKPAVGGAGVDTYLVDESNLEDMEQKCSNLAQQQDMIVQEFQSDVAERGEISLIVLGGKFSHAVLKVAKKGDFRVQDDWGGAVYDYQPTPEEIKFAEHCISNCPEFPVYARVDVFNDNRGELALAELELIEPELWFRNAPAAATMLAEAIKQTYF